jgi:hypothetical protein
MHILLLYLVVSYISYALHANYKDNIKTLSRYNWVYEILKTISWFYSFEICTVHLYFAGFTFTYYFLVVAEWLLVHVFNLLDAIHTL